LNLKPLLLFIIKFSRVRYCMTEILLCLYLLKNPNGL
jgi:hypothetical protein